MTLSGEIDYDKAAQEYAVHRSIHSGVFRELCRQARPGAHSTVLEVGCGTGNYISALAHCYGCATYGLDPSIRMLAHAQAHQEPVRWLRGQAEHLPFAESFFDLILSVDVVHHIADKAAHYHETWRTLQRGGLVCTVTDSEEIIRRREVLSGYFPETVIVELARYPGITKIEAWMEQAGLVDPKTVLVEEEYELTNAQPFRDKAYSSLHLISECAWRAGMNRLERDLERGPVRGVSRYACVWGRKPGG
jgi:ubiquinone/menaquinone biosynthesis C-methylase UbiE